MGGIIEEVRRRFLKKRARARFFLQCITVYIYKRLSVSICRNKWEKML